jgi:hypothetical protein
VALCCDAIALRGADSSAATSGHPPTVANMTSAAAIDLSICRSIRAAAP